MKSLLSEKSLSIAAIVISLIALANSFWQSHITQSHNSLTIKPYLQVSPRATGQDSDGLYIENKGTGTALIANAQFEVDGTVYSLNDMRWASIFSSLRLDPLCFSTSALKKGAAISAGEEVSLLTKTKAERTLCEIEMANFLMNSNLQLVINYAGLDGSPYEYRHNIGIR